MWVVLCVFTCLGRGVFGYLGDDLAETSQLCCNQGTSYARNHSSEDCSSSIPPDVPKQFAALCIFAMDQCCKEYFQKKRDCDSGVEIASSTKSCNATRDSVKNCCDECLRGITSSATGNVELCEFTTRGSSADELLAGAAFERCCKKDLRTRTGNSDSSASESRPVSLSRGLSSTASSIASLCEKYAPNELCAHHCIPVPGSYKCNCNPGYKLMADGRNCMEVVKNRCKPRNPCQHKCIDNGIEVRCSCRRGYKLKIDGRNCEDIDECQLDSPVCLPSAQCHNIQGSYKCIPKKVSNNAPQKPQERGQCPSGFAWNINNNACDDIDECNLPRPPCPKYLCKNTIGGYKCDGVSGDPASLPANRQGADERCPPGFAFNLAGECEDVDECALHRDDCNPLSQFCINTRGSYHCQNQASKHCPPGFKINPKTNKCEDINECEDGQDICRSDQICINVPGEYDCKLRNEYGSNRKNKCLDGMRMRPGTDICEDIDECLEGTHLCDQYQNCLNTNGSHECLCKLGYELDATTGACMDVNECATNRHNCIPGSQRCDNTVGSFLCIRLTSCGTGYILQHTSGTCEDIDECALGTHNCHHAGPEYQCENHPGSFRCVRKKSSTTSTTLPPDYYEYYESGEEMEVNQTDFKEPVVENKIPSTTTTTSTTPASIGPIDNYDLDRPVLPVMIDDNDLDDGRLDYSGSKPIQEEIQPLKPVVRQPENIEPIQPETSRQPEVQPPRRPEEFRPLQPSQPEMPKETTTPETPREPEEFKPIEPDISRQPQEVKPPPVTRPSQPEQPNFEPRQPEPRPIEPKPRDEHEFQPEKQDSNKFKPSATAPRVVFVDVGKDTATIDGKKADDGSVVVDTYDVPKNEWTKVKEKPSISCPPGFKPNDNGVCIDIDECATHRHTCSGLTEICRNTMGGYLCDCAVGFRRDFSSGLCDLITTSSTSTSTVPTTTASAERNKTFFWGYPEYRPVGPARPFRPRYMCDVGYHFNSQTRSCDDINECINGQANCADVEICVNTNGGYRCECPPNWRLDDVRHKCVPNRNTGQFPHGYANEPLFPPQNPSDVIHGFNGPKYVEPEVKQVEDRGSVITCPSGYKLGYDNTCEDIDECSTGQDRCGNLMCTNLPGGYVCSCPPGHKLGNDNVCEDVDECSLGGNMPICSQNADCMNTVGSYKCRCHKGFRSAPVNDKVCVDVDECTEHPTGSLCQHRCNNVWGGYRCSCHRGYRLSSDNSSCSDIDECTEYKSKILCVGRCLNEPGSYRCTCPSGYRLSEDKKSCIDIDECETGEATCAKGGQYAGTSDVCHNTRGSYRCHRIICPQGYKLESKHRCTRVEKVCPPADWECAHQPTTYSYNFITFVSNLYIPESKVDLFTMRGPAWPNAKMRFELRLVETNAPPNVKDKADINSFLLVHTGNQAVMSLVRSLTGPQSIELELSMELYNGEQFGGIAVARIYIYVSEYEF